MESAEVHITTRGPIGTSDKDYARRKIARVVSGSPSPVVFARVKLALEANPSVERPATAEAVLEMDGEIVRAHVAAGMMDEAIDLLQRRLRRELKNRDRRRGLHQRFQGEGWQHGRPALARTPFFPRPPNQREVVLEPPPTDRATPLEAVAEMEALGHDFFLFTDELTSQEAVVYRRADGTVTLMESEQRPNQAPETGLRPSPRVPSHIGVEQARRHLDLTDDVFVFFVDESKRGSVLHQRGDGNYGLIVPSRARRA